MGQETHALRSTKGNLCRTLQELVMTSSPRCARALLLQEGGPDRPAPWGPHLAFYSKNTLRIPGGWLFTFDLRTGFLGFLSWFFPAVWRVP